MINGTVKKNQSVEKLLDIIELMAETSVPIRLNDLSNKLNMPSATVYRFLKTLINRDYVKKNNENSKYFLTLKLKHYSDLIESNFNLSNTVHPYLRKLAEITGESASLVVMEDNMAIYIDKFDGSNRMIKSFQRIGYRAPLYCTGVGKVLLTELSKEKRTEILKDFLPFEKLTKNTITNMNDLEDELKNIVKNGLSYDNEECEIGAKCVAAPIRDFSGKIIAAISVSGPTARIDNGNIHKIEQTLLNISYKISSILGFIKNS